MDYWRLIFYLYMDGEKLGVVGPFLSYEIEIEDGPGTALDNNP